MRGWGAFLATGLFAVALAGLSWPAAGQSRDVVGEITVEGAERIEPGTVRSYLLIREGDVFDSARINRSLKSLFATGLFADVTLQRQGNRLVVVVVENPIINRIAFEGNGTLDLETLESEVTLRPRVIYTRTRVQNDVRRILSLYRLNGFFAATVDPKIIRLPQNRVDLVFEIAEGQLTKIQRIRVVGNREFSDSRLREAIRTKESRWWRFLSSDDTYDPDRLTLDRELLRRFYLNNGFADFRVLSAVAELTPDRKDFFITFTVEEGPRYKFGKVGLEVRLRNVDIEKLRQVIEIEKDEWYDTKLIEDAINAITNHIGTLGFAFIDVRPRIDRDREKKIISVTFEVNEGPRVFVERIDITGNVRTADTVIRREFRLVEGDAFNTAKLRRSKQRIENLNFFEKVAVNQVPGSAPDKAVVKVNVQEKSTGSLSVGAGFSTTTGPLADFGVSERNLLGKGQDLRLNLTVAAEKSQIDLAFTEPFFLGREVSAGFDVFRVTRDLQDESSFDSKVTGLSLRVGYPILEKLIQRWRYTIRRTKVTDVGDQASKFIKLEEGGELVSEISHTLSFDQRDSALNPTTGYFLQMGNSFAGLGGSTRFLKNTVKAAQFWPLADQWVLSIRGTAGLIVGFDDNIRLLDRFFVGGDNLRGFATSGVGPRDTTTDDALGGEWMYTAGTQVTFPLGLPVELGLSGRVFTDIGSSGKVDPSDSTVADTGSLRAGVGMGVVWRSPFGPLGMDVGFPILKESFDEKETIRVNFGTRF